MAKEEKQEMESVVEETVQTTETPVEETAQTVTPEEELEQTPETTEETQQEAVEEAVETNPFEEKYNAEHDAHLRLAAEYDNFRKRTAKEKELSYTNGKADTLEKLLPIYDNLELAVNQQTQDAAFKKGVELTMNELVKIFTALGVEIFGNVGDAFDPNLHNAVMHTEDENLGENVNCQVFRKGFKVGEKIVRFAMVQVAN